MTPPLSPFYRRVALDQTASTNDEALARARDGAAEGTLVTADRQSAGRGRRGREWVSPAGNLHLSLILRPPGGTEAAGAIGFAAALAVRDVVLGALPAGTTVTVKWPNDVLIDGAKVAGLLIETAEDALVLGVGINVVAHPENTPYPATSILAAGGAGTADSVLAAFCAAFKSRYDRWAVQGFAALREEWLACAHGLGQRIVVRLEDARFDGVFAGIDDSGALMLDLGTAGLKKITAGDVFFTPARAGGA
jgi:BirA family biotin operon repressor/biotin-[acetyl-CoA-carboxylase] ligase